MPDVKCVLIHDNFQNFKSYNIPKAQLVIADIPYNIGTDFYASRPDWYVDGDNKNGESSKARKAAFNTDFTFNIAEYFHFCNRLLKKEPGTGEKDAPCMIVFCAFQQIPKVITEAEKYGFKNYIPLVFCKNYSPQVLKANMKIVGATEYALVLYRGKLPKFRNLGEDGKAFYEFQCGNLLTDGGIPNIIIGQLDIESGEGEVRAYMWQQNGGWTLNRFLDRMSKVDKSLYCFELSPTEFMKRSGKVSVKETDRPEISELRSLAVEKIEKMYEDRHTILKDCIYGDLKYPVVVKAWTPAEADTIYVIDKLERNSYCLEKMEKWIQILDEYEENYRRIVQRSSIGILQLVVEEACSDEQKEYYEKDFRDICEKFYRNRELEIDIIERDTLEKNTNLEKDNKIYISSISVLPVKKEMIYAMDIGIVAQVSATRPVLVGDYDSIQEINRQIEQYYQKTWDEWKEHIECHQNDEMMLERITSQPNKNEISDGTLTDELTYEVTHNDSSILSILFDRYLYLGGAHGTPLRKSMVVNLNTGEPIKLHEILPVSFSELMDILRNQLYVRYGSEDTEVLEVCYKNIVDLYHEVDEFKFYIRYSALYIYFDVYEISSYSMGYVDLYIMDLQEFLSERCDISECDIVRKQAIFEKIFKPNIR